MMRFHAHRFIFCNQIKHEKPLKFLSSSPYHPQWLKKRKKAEIPRLSTYPLQTDKTRKHAVFHNHRLILLKNLQQEKMLRSHAPCFILCHQLKHEKTLKFSCLRLIVHNKKNKKKCWGFAFITLFSSIN